MRRALHGATGYVLILMWFAMITPIQKTKYEYAGAIWILTLATFLISRALLRALETRRARLA